MRTTGYCLTYKSAKEAFHFAALLASLNYKVKLGKMAGVWYVVFPTAITESQFKQWQE